jgi:DNA adenine methylase
MSQTTLLRYIGGKSKLIHKIAPFVKVPPTGVYCEPFVGGGSVGIAVASTTAYRQAQVVLNDFDPEVANFWSQVINPNKVEVTALIDRIKECLPTLALYDEIKASSPTDPIGRAFRFLFLNRASHIASHGKRPLGGRKQANPDSDIASRFKVDNVISEFLRARRIFLGRTTVLCASARTGLPVRTKVHA